MSNEIFIYKIINIITNLCYIGQSKDPTRRFKQHCTFQKSSNFYIRNTLKKYGKDSFKLEIIDVAQNREEANFLERLYIIEENTLSPNGYNLKLDEYSDRLPESCERMSKSQKGKKKSPAFIKRRKEYMSGPENHWTGKKHSAESKRKQSDKKRKIPVVGIREDETIFLKSIRESLKIPEEKFNPSDICKCLKNSSLTHKGFTWKYLKDFMSL